MSHGSPSRPLLKFAVLFFGLLLPALGQEPNGNPKEQEAKPQLRFICVSSLSEDQEVILASQDEKGAWQEYGSLKLRSSLITEWLPAHTGELHLALRVSDRLKSIGRFTYPEGTKRALAVLLADPAKSTYSVDVIDPAKLKFIKGSALLVNYSSLNGAVVLGSLKTRIKPGARMIVKPIPEANGMYRMMVAYAPTDKELVPCYDRYVSDNPDARDIIFLLPDQTLGLKVFSLSEFGPFD
jgi:hypothetical protein